MLSNETLFNTIEYTLFERILVTIILFCICIVGVIGKFCLKRKKNLIFINWKRKFNCSCCGYTKTKL